MSAPHSPTTTVCMPTYNRSQMLRESIGSVLNQTFKDFEIVVSDNASSDDTQSLVRSLGDDRIRYYRQTTNIGCVPNLNFTLKQARGRYITFLFDDDLMMPDNLERKVEVLARERSVGLIHSRYHIINEVGNIVRASTNQGHGPERDRDSLEPGQVFLKRMLAGMGEVLPASAMFRRECVERLGILDETVCCDDFEYWMRISVYYDVAYLSAPLVMWRAHPGTVTSRFLVGGKTGLTPRYLFDSLRCKRNILDRYGKDIPDVQDLRKMLRRQTAERMAFQADCMLDEGSARSEVRRFLLGMGSEFPHLYATRLYWKMLAKAVVPSHGIRMLKKLRHSISH